MDPKILFVFIRKFQAEFLIGTIVLITYVPTFIWMWDRWFARDSYYSHGILIPFVTAYLIWQQKDALKASPRSSDPLGLYLFCLGIIIHIFSAIFRVYFSSGFSFLIVLFGLVLYFFGRKIFNIVFFPLLFLSFMIPLPMVVIANISFKLKLFAAQIAGVMLNNMRIPCIQEGSVIKMRHSQVVVDDVCSGLRSLISLAALGGIFAYWMKSGVIRKSILFLSTIPIAIITNVIRIMFLAIVSEVWGPQYASGLVHDISGFMVFALAFVLLHAVSKLLE